MAYNGKLISVSDKANKWGVLIDTDDKGKVWFDVWDKKLAGESSAEHEAVCDIHDWKGQRVRFEATRGKLRDPDGPEDGERWNATITDIALEEGGPEKPITEMVEDELVAEAKREVSQPEPSGEQAEEHAEPESDDLTRLQMELMNVQAKWFSEVRRQLNDCIARYEELAKRGA